MTIVDVPTSVTIDGVPLIAQIISQTGRTSVLPGNVTATIPPSVVGVVNIEKLVYTMSSAETAPSEMQIEW